MNETAETTARGIYTVCFLTFMIPCNCKLVSFFFKSLNKPFKDHSKQTTIINLEEIFSEFSDVFTCFSLMVTHVQDNSENVRSKPCSVLVELF